MRNILAQLQHRGVRLEEYRALEIFGGTGNFHTKDYADKVANLEIWEIDPKCLGYLRKNFPKAQIRITDSYREIRKVSRKYDLIIVDNPMSTYGGHCEHFDLFPDIFRAATDSFILILNVIPRMNSFARMNYPYLFNPMQLACRKMFYITEKPENLSLKEIMVAYKGLVEASGLHLDWFFFERRSLLFPVYYLVMKIER